MPKKGGKGKKKKSNIPDWMPDELKKVAQDAVLLTGLLQGPTSDNPKPIIGRAQAAIFLRMFVNPTKMNPKKEEAIGQSAIEFAWKMVKDGDSNEKTIATGLLETLTRVDSGREALAALRPWSLLWTGVSQGSAAYSAECMAVLCNLIQGWQTGLELALENKRLLMRFLKEASLRPLLLALTLFKEMPTCGGRTATVRASHLIAELLAPPIDEELGGSKTDRDNQERAHQQILAAKGLQALVDLAGARDVAVADLAARDNAVLSLHYILKAGNAALRDEFIAIGGIQAMVCVLSDQNTQVVDPAATGPAPLLSLLTRARAAGCLRAIMKPDPERAQQLGTARREVLEAEMAARPVSAYATLQPQFAYAREPLADRPQTALAPRGDIRASKLGELGPASILEAQLRMLDGSMRPQSRFLSPASPGFNPYTRVMSPGKERMPPSPRPHTALGPVGDIDISDWGPSALDMDPLDDTLRYESLLVDEAMRVFAMERAERVAQAGAVPYLISLCCGPEGPLPDKEAAPVEGAGAVKGKKKKKKKKKTPAVPGTEEGQRYATGCLRVLALTKGHRQEMMQAGVLRYLAPLLMSRNHKARWHARNIVLALASDEENRETLQLYLYTSKKKLHWKTIDGVPQFIAMTNVPVHRPEPSTAPEMLYGATHRLARTAAEIKEADARKRFGTAAMLRPGSGGKR